MHTAPGHGADDYIIWIANQKTLHERGIDTTIPFTVDADGVLTKEAPGFEGKRVLKENGDKGDANDAVIKALSEAGNIIARSRLKHQYPHSWRSKKPIIFRNTPQWFIAMDKQFLAVPTLIAASRQTAGSRRSRFPLTRTRATTRSRTHADAAPGRARRDRRTEWVPETGENRITGMIANRPIGSSRASAPGACPSPCSLQGRPRRPQGRRHPRAIERRQRRHRRCLRQGRRRRLVRRRARPSASSAPNYDPAKWEQVRDVLDVWFDSGSTHAFTLEDPEHFPGLAGIKRVRDGGADRVMYLEGSDQHRGWFHSSLLESCGTRGRAPFDVVLTHGFILDEKGEEKMSKSKGNMLSPQEVMKTSGADILRLWVASADTTNDIRFGTRIVQSAAEAYRKLRNTLRWMLGALHYFTPSSRFRAATCPSSRA